MQKAYVIPLLEIYFNQKMENGEYFGKVKYRGKKKTTY